MLLQKEGRRCPEMSPKKISNPTFRRKYAISPFDLEIRSTYHQVSRTRTYALVNTTSDPITQLATTHSPDALASQTGSRCNV
jgi:hypothetical protein